ncbi:hypothetical protein C1H46_038009 [Malus baccata]|uniref:Uncharacterized protein n=1 Tax=Malus baccata TaxID=106549 RepID=A0A540KQJ6_MALBA|nr:hypothetical protein C1H46_038009 [Malus baccata]
MGERNATRLVRGGYRVGSVCCELKPAGQPNVIGLPVFEIIVTRRNIQAIPNGVGRNYIVPCINL